MLATSTIRTTLFISSIWSLFAAEPVLERKPSSFPTKLNTKLSILNQRNEVISPFRLSTGQRLGLMIFVQKTCPISEYYAKQIANLCDVQLRGQVQCSIVYPLMGITQKAVDDHGKRYRLAEDSQTRLIADQNFTLAASTGVTVTPEAVLFRGDGQILYRGRIDNRFAGWTKRRTVVTQNDLADAIESALWDPSAAFLRTSPAVGCWIEKKGIQ